MSYDMNSAASEMQALYAATRASYQRAIESVEITYPVPLNADEKAALEAAVVAAFPLAAEGVLPMADDIDADGDLARGTLSKVLEAVAGSRQHRCAMRVAGRVVRSYHPSWD